MAREYDSDTLAMNILGEKWWSHLRTHEPVPTFSDAYDAWKVGFFPWLWADIIANPVDDSFGRSRADGQELELFRKTLPRFATFQKWYYRQTQREKKATEEAALARGDTILRAAMKEKAAHPEKRVGDIVRELGLADTEVQK